MLQIIKICKRISSNLQLIPPSENPTRILSYTSLLMTPHEPPSPSSTLENLPPSAGSTRTSNSLLLSRLQPPNPLDLSDALLRHSEPEGLTSIFFLHHAFSGHSFGDSPAVHCRCQSCLAASRSASLAARASVASLRRRSFSQAACSNSDLRRSTSAVTAPRNHESSPVTAVSRLVFIVPNVLFIVFREAIASTLPIVPCQLS